MSRRKPTHRAVCAEPECRESAFWEFDRVTDMREHARRLHESPWKCTRHSNPETVLSAANSERMTVLTATPGAGVISDHLFWHDGQALRSGLIYGPGFKAYAQDFTAGTRLVITARVEPVSTCRHPESHWIAGGKEDHDDPPLWRCDDCGEVDTTPWPTVWCDTCGGPEPVVEESDEQIGFEEQAREVRVTRLDCGHEIVRPAR